MTDLLSSRGVLELECNPPPQKKKKKKKKRRKKYINNRMACTKYETCAIKIKIQYKCQVKLTFCAFADPEGGHGGPDPPPPENQKNIGLIRNAGPDHLINYKYNGNVQTDRLINCL